LHCRTSEEAQGGLSCQVDVLHDGFVDTRMHRAPEEAMITLIAVGIVFVIGGYAHYASLNGRVVLIACVVILTLALIADWFIEQPSRFDL
jgi:hypothetical protein